MKELFKALAAFQQEVPVIHKGASGYGCSYADLPAIFEVINPLLKKHGLGFTQSVIDKSLLTVVFHVESGEFLEGKADIPQGVQLAKMNDFQVLGSAITYMRRYQLSAMLGLVTDKDTDASGTQDRATKKPAFVKTVEEYKSEIANAKDMKALSAVATQLNLDKTITKEEKAELLPIYEAKQVFFTPSK